MPETVLEFGTPLFKKVMSRVNLGTQETPVYGNADTFCVLPSATTLADSVELVGFTAKHQSTVAEQGLSGNIAIQLPEGKVYARVKGPIEAGVSVGMSPGHDYLVAASSGVTAIGVTQSKITSDVTAVVIPIIIGAGGGGGSSISMMAKWG